MDFEIAYTHGGARVDMLCETNLWVILGASKMDMNWWDVVFKGEGNALKQSCTIVTMYFTANIK